VANSHPTDALLLGGTGPSTRPILPAQEGIRALRRAVNTKQDGASRLKRLDLPNTIGDKGYIGTGMHTPQRKPPGQRLHKGVKAYNKDINALRSAVERSIAHIKTWRILHTDYRRPLTTYQTAFQAVHALHFFELSSE